MGLRFDTDPSERAVPTGRLKAAAGEGQDVPIDTEAEARDAVQRWLDANNGPGKYRVTAMLDLGPIWRVMWVGATDPGYVNLSRVDKSTGEVEPDLASAAHLGPSARDTFETMMRSAIKPQLKSLGLRASGTTFQLPAPDHFAAFGIQQSGDNVWVRAKFTVNVRVVSNQEWAARQARLGRTGPPSPNARSGVGWWTRLGELTPGGHDRWWTVWGGFPTDDVAQEVVTAIRDYGLPAMREKIETSTSS
jgi:hypothetical protein